MKLALLIIILVLVAGALTIGSVYLLAGLAWSLLAAAAVLLGIALALRAGLANG